MASNREMAEHLASCYEALYQVLGAGASEITTDAYVVLAHEIAREFGGLALELETYAGSPRIESSDLLEGLMRFSLDQDPSGALAMFAVSMAVGPRLLVTLLDARGAMDDDPTLLGLLNHGSQVCVGVIRRIGDLASDEPPIEDPAWQEAARDIVNTLESAGNAESMGLSR